MIYQTGFTQGQPSGQNQLHSFNPLTTSVPHHMETSQLLYMETELTGFFMMGEIGSQWIKGLKKRVTHFTDKPNSIFITPKHDFH